MKKPGDEVRFVPARGSMELAPVTARKRDDVLVLTAPLDANVHVNDTFELDGAFCRVAGVLWGTDTLCVIVEVVE